MEYINDLIYNYKNFIIFVLITLILNVIIFLFVFNNVCTNDEVIIEKKDVVEQTEELKKINVDIKGAVKVPGVYTFNESNLVKDAIDKSGGLLDTADTTYINLSKKLNDEMVIIIYTKEEIDKLSKGEITINNLESCKCPEVKNDSCVKDEVSNKPVETNSSSSIININTAPLSELLNIPGIGEVKAKAIIEYREKNLFNNIKDITNVTGIGEATFEKIKDYITT